MVGWVRLDGVAVKPLALIALLFLAGCASAPLSHDVIPDDYDLVIISSQKSAIEWYQRKWHEAPKNIPHVMYIAVDTPREGGMWSTGNRIYFWIKQPNMAGSFEHEYRHHLNHANFRGATSGTREDEESVK